MLDQQAPSLGAVIAAAIDARLVNVHTHLPARIESYDAAQQRCSVQVELRQGFFGETGERTGLKLPVIPDVPVKFEGGGGFRSTYPLQRGDQVWLEISEASLALWKPRGGDVDPIDDRRMHLSDAIAVTGLRDGTRPLKNCPTDRMSLGHDEGATVEITQTAVRIGGNTGTEPTYKATSAQTALSTFLAALNTFAGTCTTAPPGTAAALATASTALLAALTAAQTVIAQVK
mgnify:CR=1 FL=1